MTSGTIDENILQRVRGEFLEMPGLSLTPGQARRLWNLEPAACEMLLQALVADAFLRPTSSGAFVLAVTRVGASDSRSRGRTAHDPYAGEHHAPDRSRLSR